jgi:subtilisin family serine protease
LKVSVTSHIYRDAEELWDYVKRIYREATLSYKSPSGVIFVECSDQTYREMTRDPNIQVTITSKIKLTQASPLQEAPVAPAAPEIWVNTVAKRVGAEIAWESGFRGEGVTVAVLDSGINPHKTLKGKIAYEEALITNTTTDQFGHGTSVASIVAGEDPSTGFTGIAPKASIINIKMINDRGESDEELAVKAVDRAVELKADIINISWGLTDTGNPNEPIRIAVRNAAKQNIVIVCAAGNCLTADTLVYTKNGPIEIAKLKPGDEVYSLENPTKIAETNTYHWVTKGTLIQLTKKRHILNEKIVLAKVKRVIYNGKQPVYLLKTKTRSIKATANHPFLVYDKTTRQLQWKTLSEIDIGTPIVILKKLPEEKGEGINPKLARVIGVWFGDGSIRFRSRNAIEGVHEIVFQRAKFLGIEAVREIKLLGEADVYDIEVEGTHNFIAEGIVVHNSGPAPTTITSPATDPVTVAVGSCTASEIVSYFSSRGPTKEGLVKPEGLGFGENLIVADPKTPDGLAKATGTSFTAPQGSGIAALGRQIFREAMTREWIERGLKYASTKPPSAPAPKTVKDNDYGYGIPDFRIYGAVATIPGVAPAAINPNNILNLILLALFARVIA